MTGYVLTSGVWLDQRIGCAVLVWGAPCNCVESYGPREMARVMGRQVRPGEWELPAWEVDLLRDIARGCEAEESDRVAARARRAT